MSAAAEPSVPSPLQAQVHVLDGHQVALDLYSAVGPLRGAAVLSHGFTRSRRTLAGHAQALADAGVLAVTPDLPCTCDFRCNAEAVAAPWVSVLPALWRDEVIEVASPCDFKSPTDWMSRLACGNNVPARQQQVRQGLLDAAERWLR